jgi:ElaB/YqjD/DUF883 family membrane-anchored ribosome-binding protein
MGRASDEELRHQLAGTVRSTRAELESTFGALREVVGESLDWRAWVERNPWTAISIAALIGLRLGRGRWF